MSDQPRLSIVIPVLDAESGLDVMLARLDGELHAGDEIVVSDGGSSDGSTAVAASHGARIVEAERGRGNQLRAGARAAAGDWFLFLHADTHLDTGWRKAVDEFAAARDAGNRAAAFRFALDDDRPAARRLERFVAWRSRVLGLPYGDQGLLISRALYDAIGGYEPVPLMEDVGIVRRLGRRRITCLELNAVTSAARFRREGYLRRSARNLTCLGLYFLGVPAPLLRRIYG